MSDEPKPTNHPEGQIPPISSGASNPTPKLETPKVGQQSQRPTELEERRQLELPKILEPIYTLFVKLAGRRWAPTLWTGATVFVSAASAIVTVLWTLALWDSYRPKITIVPGPTFDPKAPFMTAFIIQNQGSLPIRNVLFDSTWVNADDLNGTRNVMAGVSRITKLKSLEQHALINVFAVGKNQPAKPQSVITTPIMPIENHAIVLWFDIQYDPQFFGKRRESIYFFGMWDSETNLQWLPTGGVDIRTETASADLIERANAITTSIRKKMSATTNSSSTNDAKSPSTTNDGENVHTNSVTQSKK